MRTLIKNALVYSASGSEFKLGSLMFAEDKIIPVSNEFDRIVDADGAYLVPGFVDVHTHGRAGFDFCNADADEMQTMSKSYLSVGTTSVFPTLASAPYGELLTAIDRINSLKGKTKGASFDGIHLEGRYLNSKKRGAHATELLAKPNADEIGELILRMSTPCHITAALELDEDLSFSERVKQSGATLAIGHTNADYALALKLYNEYNISFSHLFNAMPPLSHRDAGAVCAGLTSGAYCELICDGLHISPEMISLAYRCLGSSRLSLITDSMSATGCSDGIYSIAGCRCTVKDGKATTDEGNLAGSTLDMKTAVENLMRFCSIPLEKALRCATLTPAEQVGIDSIVGSLDIGKRADLLLIGKNGDKLNILKTFCRGVEFAK